MDRSLRRIGAGRRLQFEIRNQRHRTGRDHRRRRYHVEQHRDPGQRSGSGAECRRPRLLRVRQERPFAGSAPDAGPSGRVVEALSDGPCRDRGPLRRARHARVQHGARRPPREHGEILSGRAGHRSRPPRNRELRRRAAGGVGNRRGRVVAEPSRRHRRSISVQEAPLRSIRLTAAIALGLVGAWVGSASAEEGSPAAAQLELRVQQLEEQIRELTGQIETQGHQIQVLNDQLQKLRSDTDLRFNDLEGNGNGAPAGAAAAAAPQASPRAAPPAEGEAGPPTPIAPGAAPRILGTIPAGSAPPEPPPEAAAPPTPQEQYEAALELYHQGNYPQAEKGFRAFVAQFPKDPLAGNAAFWMGESYFVRGKYQDAAGSFADSLQKYPKGAKAPDMLLDLGKSLAKLGRTPDACAAFATLEAKYPTAAPTLKRQAQQEKTRLKCG